MSTTRGARGSRPSAANTESPSPPLSTAAKSRAVNCWSLSGEAARGIEALLELGLAAGGHVPPSKAYVWRNLPLDVPHVLTYFVAHEGHHRGQIVMLARQLGHRLPASVTGGLWEWNKRAREPRASIRLE